MGQDSNSAPPKDPALTGRLYSPRTGTYETSRNMQGNWRAPAKTEQPPPGNNLNCQLARPETAETGQTKEVSNNQKKEPPKVMHILSRHEQPSPFHRVKDLQTLD